MYEGHRYKGTKEFSNTRFDELHISKNFCHVGIFSFSNDERRHADYRAIYRSFH